MFAIKIKYKTFSLKEIEKIDSEPFYKLEYNAVGNSGYKTMEVSQ